MGLPMRNLLPLYHDIDRALKRSLDKAGHKPSCRKSCAACCHGMQVTVHILEGIETARFLGQKHGIDYLKRLGPELYRQSALLANPATSAAVWKVRGEPCPLLRDSLCTAYEARPLQCRAWLSVDDPAKCSIPGGKITAVDNTWPIEQMLVPFQRTAHDNGIPPSYGPLQYQMLLAMLIMTIGKEAYRQRVEGTTLAGALSAIPWMHIEDEERSSRARRMAWAELRSTGVRLLRPQEVLDWPEMREIGAATHTAVAASA